MSTMPFNLNPGADRWGGLVDASGAVCETICLSDVQPEVVAWLWLNHIPVGKLSIIAGNPGSGKTWLTSDLAARISTGRGFPDAPHQTEMPRGVLIVNAEDGVADTLVPRLIAAGADLSRVHAVPLLGERGAPPIAWWTLAGSGRLEQWIDECPACVSVFIDPVGAFVGDRDDNSNGQVRGMLGPLADIAARRGVAIILVSHLSKSGSRSALTRFLGSIAWTGGPRAAWLVARDPDDENRRLFLPVKSNLGPPVPGRAYRIAGEPPKIEWEHAPLTMSADEAMEALVDDGSDAADRDAAEAFLTEFLGDRRRVPAVEVFEAGAAHRLKPKALRRALKSIGGTREKSGFRDGWVWYIPLEGSSDAPEVTNMSAPPSRASSASSTSRFDPEPENPDWAKSL